jgi:molybdenum cofactor guanylyltransferase
MSEAPQRNGVDISVNTFLLVGGNSSRMGQDKGLLPFQGSVLADVLARRLAALGPVTLLGNPSQYAHLGFPVWSDSPRPDGPLTALCTALEQTDSDWNLFLACDLPAISHSILQSIVDTALSDPSQLDAVVAAPADLPKQALCAAYHRRSAAHLRSLYQQGERAPKRTLNLLRVRYLTDLPPENFVNCNTAYDWDAFLSSPIAQQTQPAAEPGQHD